MKVSKLPLIEIDFLIAKLMGVKVMRFENMHHHIAEPHCAIESEFEPEGPANHYDLKLFKMWRWYEPTKDWAIAGPIIAQERVCIIFSDDEDLAEKPYAWAYYSGGPDDLEEVNFEQDGETACEAAMRSIVARYFGNDIDLDNLPTIKRKAQVKVSVFCEAIVDDQYGDIMLEVEAETGEEAESLAMEEVRKAQPDYEILDVYFLGWK